MSYVYGVILVVVGSIGNNLGNNLVSLGHKTHKEKTHSKGGDLTMVSDVSEMASSVKAGEEDSFFTWCNVGRIVFVLGSLFTFASFAFGAQSLIASLESVQFVSNVVFVYYVHKEPVTRRMILATLSIVGGNVLVVIFAEHAAKKFTSDDMINLYKTNNIYHGYMVLAFILWGVTSYSYSTYHDSRMNKRTLMWNHSFMEPFTYAVSSSIIGTQAVLNSKCLALLLEATTTGTKNEFAFWYFYFILGTWLALVAYWLTRLDGGLALFPPCFIIPVMQVFFVFFAIVCGGIYFEEFVHFTVTQFVGFIAGVLMILSGVYGLAPLDMELFVPGDPREHDPSKICSPCAGGLGMVHSELVLPLGQKDPDDVELDRMFDGHITSKPVPAEDLTLFTSSLVGDASVDPVNDLSLSAVMIEPQNSTSNFPRATKSSARGTRKIVKRPLQDLQPLQLPPVTTRGTNGLGTSTSLEESPDTIPPICQDSPSVSERSSLLPHHQGVATSSTLSPAKSFRAEVPPLAMHTLAAAVEGV